VLEHTDAFRLAWCFQGALAATAALGGDGGEARAWLDRAERLGGQRHRLFLPWYRMWGAWTLAAGGDTTAAAEAAGAAAGLARAVDLPTVEAAALYDQVRLGAARPARLTELAVTLETPMAAAVATAATGAGAGAGDALTEAGAAFAALGQHLLAAEAFSTAAQAYRRADRRTPSALSMERATELRARCEGATTPLLTQAPAIAGLTRREREVALLAARYSSRQIAERLGLSVTTVNNHLARAYAKLGVSRRSQLRALLDDAPTGSA
jgi:DNA-binding CsgD family transcriptional regulator